jgi:2-keto-4-pentenoate hydratase
MDASELCAAIESVHAGIEFHQYRFWYGEPTSQELIVSNGIHMGLVIGAAHNPASLDLSSEAMQLIVNGIVEASGTGREIMGGPLQSLAWLVQHAASRDEHVRAGDLVIPGAATKLIRVAAGNLIESRFAAIGSCFADLV